MLFAPFADWDIDHIHDQLAEQGYCRLDGLIPPSLLDEARRQAETAVDANAGDYVAFTGPARLDGTLLRDLQGDSGFRAFCHALYRRETGQEPTSEGFYQVFRCLKGQGGQQNSCYLHFDSYVVTALIPVAMPQSGRSGDLLLLEHRRPLRRRYLVGVVEKALLDRGPVQRLLWWLIRRGSLRVTRLRLQPGSLYLFLGYHTLHANEPCDADQLRATLLFHYGNPHERSATRIWLERLRHSGQGHIRPTS